MEQLKEIFNLNYYKQLSNDIFSVFNDFLSKKFLKEVTQNLDYLSLNQRLRNTTIILDKYLTKDYEKNLKILHLVIQKYENRYSNLIFPDYIGVFGRDNFDLSMEYLSIFTQFGSSEFAIREFLKQDFYRTIKIMEKWSKSENKHIRRLASEGSRSRLPWSFKLDEVIKNPKSTRNILENLKNDSELYVKKSVANHINDFTKDNQEYALNLVKSWNQKDNNTAWIIKHSMRNLIKQGNPKCLELFNFNKNIEIEIENFILTRQINLGNYLEFSFNILSKTEKTQKLVIDYTIYYLKKSGEHSKKVFKLKEYFLKSNENLKIIKKQLIKDFSTRKHYLGTHFIEIQINGKIFLKEEFLLNL